MEKKQSRQIQEILYFLEKEKQRTRLLIPVKPKNSKDAEWYFSNWQERIGEIVFFGLYLMRFNAGNNT